MPHLHAIAVPGRGGRKSGRQDETGRAPLRRAPFVFRSLKQMATYFVSPSFFAIDVMRSMTRLL
jgi:hypothetical protein